MEPSHEIHSDRPRTYPLQLMSPVIAGVLVVMGLMSGDPVPVALGGGLGLFVYFTRHARYTILHDSLVIHYGRPRQKTLPLADIEDVQLALRGQGLFVRQKRGVGLLIRPTDPELFLERLDEARRGLVQ